MGLVEHLSPNGRMLLSTPVHQAGVWLDPPWEHHRIEYSPDTLLDLLHRYFARVDRPDNGTLPHREVFDVLKGSGIRYVLGMNPLVCSRPIPRAARPSRRTLTPGSERRDRDERHTGSGNESGPGDVDTGTPQTRPAPLPPPVGERGAARWPLLPGPGGALASGVGCAVRR